MDFFTDPFILIFIILPISTFIVSFILALLIDGKAKFIVVPLVFILYCIFTFTIFNATFFIYSFIYTGISFMSTLIASALQKKKNVK